MSIPGTNNPASKGWSGIFHFPYRINAQEPLRDHEITHGDFRYRVYAPFLVRSQASPVTDDVQPDLWPDFSWHESVPQRLRGEPTAPVEMRYNCAPGRPAIWYDGLRVDISGPSSEETISQFVFRFMLWLRHLSGQPWIGAVDRHSESILKRLFEIDGNGAATSEIYPFSRMVGAQFRCVTDAMWQQAFQLAASGQEVPIHSNLFFDGVNAAATTDYPRAIMNLAMALESCRDVNFSRLHPAKVIEGIGPKLQPPFDHTDLLKHLSSDAKLAFDRDFSSERPEHWPELKKLYVARHHVAHGKGAVFRTAEGIKSVDRESFRGMLLAAGIALQWMELLQRK